MTRLFMAGAAGLLVAGLASGTALAGGMAAPVMDEAVVAEDAASSADDNWVGILMLVLVAAAVASN
jgi:hypothetical protein